MKSLASAYKVAIAGLAFTGFVVLAFAASAGEISNGVVKIAGG